MNIEYTQKEVEHLRTENDAIRKAMWDIINYLNAFVVLLDENMNIKLVNWYLANKLGYENEKDLIDKCWLDFIKPEERTMIKNIHEHIVKGCPHPERHKEVVNEIIGKDGNSVIVKWFNMAANHGLNMTFSIGIPSEIPKEESEESVRAYYRDVIERDKTMIKSIIDTFNYDSQTC
jgi:PAS domain S-box-containing protein